MRVFFHIDLDAFFASAEALDHPEYRGVPLIIGANPRHGKGRGVVSTCSYEARVYGLRSGMPISKAWELCPNGVYLFPRFQRYSELSNQFKSIVKRYSTLYRSGGIDEAYLEMTPSTPDFKSAYQQAITLQTEILQNVGLSCSIGISFTPTLAKIASDYQKPNGLTIITPENYQALLGVKDIACIPGIGKKTKRFYYDRGYHTVGDLYATSLPKISQELGDHGLYAWRVANGQGNFFNFEDGFEKESQKSISKERTFGQDISDPAVIIEKLTQLNQALHKEMQEKGLAYRTCSLKIRFHGFVTYTRAKSFSTPTCDELKALKALLQQMEEFRRPSRKIRLIGIRFSNLVEKSHQKTSHIGSLYNYMNVDKLVL